MRGPQHLEQLVVDLVDERLDVRLVQLAPSLAHRTLPHQTVDVRCERR